MMRSTTSLLVSTSHTRLNLNLGVPIFQVAMRNGEQKTGWIKHRKEKSNYGLSCAHMLVVPLWFIVPLRFSLISLVSGGSALLAHGDSFLLLINKPETKYTIHIHNEPLMEPSSYAWQRAGELQRANSATTEPASNLQTSLIRSNSIPQQCTGMEGSRGESSLDSLRTAGGQHHGGDSQPTMLLLCGAPGSGTVQLMFICAWPRLHTLWGMASSGIMCR